MSDTVQRAIAVVGVGAILPDAPTAPAFWQNIKNKRYSISETPPERWSLADYYDPDPSAPDKTYSKIGGWVRGFQFDWKKYRIPPRVAEAMDQSQQWAVTIAAEALADYGYPERPLDTDRTGVILGTAMGGELQYITTMRIQFPEYRNALQSVTQFNQLPASVQEAILAQWHERLDATLPPITEDTMPGELPNILSGRVANVLNLRGPSFITDAACASSFAAINAAVEMLTAGQVDAVLTGGVDRNMGAASFVKFCKIGALSATGSRPFGDGADGFVMGEGSAAFLIKRLADAERDGDKIYAVIRGVGGSSDGKGKGITAPNPIGQILATQRAWANAGLDPASATLLEAHGTSTKVGDVVELESLGQVFGQAPRAGIALGSAKSNIGHLKAGAGAAGFLKAVMAVYEKVLPPTLNAERPNPNADFTHSPFRLNHDLQEWAQPNGFPRRAGVSSYGFGGTNFHLVLEEHVPGMLRNEKTLFSGVQVGRETSRQGDRETSRQGDRETSRQGDRETSRQGDRETSKQVDQGQDGNGSGLVYLSTSALSTSALSTSALSTSKQPVRGIFAIGAASPVELKNKLDDAWRKVEGGWAPGLATAQTGFATAQTGFATAQTPTQPTATRPTWEAPSQAELNAPERLVVDFGDHGELLDKLAKARKAAGFDNPQAWKALSAQGIFRGSGAAPGKIAFLFPGQGSQYSNMGRELAALEPLVAETFREADAVMTPILGRSLTSYIFVDSADPAAMKQAERDLMQTAITQPAMLTLDTAFYKLLAEYGFHPDMVMGHSLGEYGALIAAGIMPFADALEASAARGSEMTKVSWDDNGWMAAVMAPYDVVMQTLGEIDGYVVAANINSYNQCVVGGASKAVEQAIERFTAKGFQAMRIPVSHAFHTRIVAPASKPLRKVLDRLSISEPRLPVVANVTGELYPTTIEGIKDILELQVASPVQWIKGLETMYREGCRTFVEVGPKKALKGFVDDVLGSKPDVVALFTNHPKTGELPSFNQALCGLYAAGYGARAEIGLLVDSVTASAPVTQSPSHPVTQSHSHPITQSPNHPITQSTPTPTKEIAMSQPSLPADPSGTVPSALGQLAQALQQLAANAPSASARTAQPYDRNEPPLGSVVISGTGLGLPGPHKSLMDPDNALRILRGEQFIDLIPERFRQRILDKRITRLVKAEDGGGSFQVITDPAEVIKLAGRAGQFDLTEEYGVPAKLVEALDITTQYCFAAGLDALREAGIPLVQTWHKTTTGKFLPDRWLLPEALRDETGVIFASAFPGGDRFAEEFTTYYTWENRRMQLAMLEDLRLYTGDMQTLQEINRRIGDLREQMEREPYAFDRRFIFRILAMGHSQFAEYIGARGPNTHVNAACASTAQAVAIAEDWIRSGRCRRVLVLGGDDVTSEHLMEWVGAGFLALGASATDDRVDEAALPFDRRRHGTILGMGACGLVLESEDAVRERGMRGIVELLSSETRNSAYHGSRLDVSHISQVMESLVASAERRFGVNRYAMASQTVFMSHETYTPARGGSASAEVIALRNTFGEAASDIVVANTKGFTGHPMGVGVEDVIAVKILEYGIVPPVPNFKEVDPELGVLNLSRGGRYPVQYALHLAAGFGSQISLTLTRRIPGGLDRVDDRLRYQHWLDGASGYDRAELEVIKRNLRLRSLDGPGRAAAPSPWRYGIGPSVRAAAPGDGNAPAAYHPQPMPAVRELLGKPVADTVTRWQGDKVTGESAVPSAPPPAAPAPKPAPVVEPAAPPPPPAAPATIAAPTAAAAAVPSTPPAPVTQSPSPSGMVPNHPVTLSSDTVASQVLGIVADKTGYPQDMLDLDLDLEADLGIDTVKQAETFQAVREAFDIPQQEGLSLRDYPTLESVIGFVHTMRPDLQKTGLLDDSVTVAAPAIQPSSPAGMVPSHPVTQPPSHLITQSSDAVAATVLGIVAEKTGYPQDMLDLDLDLEADLGIDTVKQAETFQAVREAFDIPQQEGLSLRDYPTLESVIGFVHTMRPDLQKTGLLDDSVTVAAPAIQPSSPAGMVPSHPVTQPPSHLITQSSDAVAATVLGIVAAKTGYPEDMLDLDLDLEADLGIDTVKQAETFQAVREAFDIPQFEGLSLRDYPTLESVIGFVHTMRPDLQKTGLLDDSVTVAAPAIQPSSPAGMVPSHPVTQPPSHLITQSSDAVAATVLGIVAAKTGYPEDMLELDLDLEADLGIDTVKQAETLVAIREAYDIPLQEGLSLRDYPTLQSVIGFVYAMRPDLQKTGLLDDSVTVAAPAIQPSSPAGMVPSHPVTQPPSHLITQSSDAVAATVLGIVAAKTGYPEDMLELDLDLEADLGIDTVKQAETLVAIREAYDIPLQEGLSLRDYPTLQSVIGFVYAMRPDLQKTGLSGDSVTGIAPVIQPSSPAGMAPSHPVTQSTNQPITQSPAAVKTIGTLEDADKMPRRVPVASLRPALELCKPTGVTLGGDSRVVVMLDRGGVGKSLVNRLEKLGASALTLEPGVATDVLDKQLKDWLAEGPIQGVYWLPALDVEPAIEEMSLEEWREHNRIRVKNLYTAMRALYDSVRGPNTFLVAGTRLGGLHGYGAAGATAPLGGAVAGFSKAYAMEQMLRPEDAGKGTTVKVVDFEWSRKTAEPAETLIAETLYDPGIVEVGHKDGLRYTVTLVEKPARDGQPGMTLDKDTVFVVTGAAGGITSAITTDLAAGAAGGVFYLLDLVLAPARDDKHIKLLRAGRDVLKQALIAEAKAGGEKVTPKQVDDKLMGIERSEAALRAIETVEAAGGTAYYHSMDLRDGAAVAAVVEDIRQRYGKIDVLLHAGGLLIDRTLPNKEPQQFSLVFDVKADGFFNLIKAARGLPIGATVSFSSVAGRFGNNGQSDYASANDLLCKISNSMRAWRPETRGIAIDWTAWGEIGMASRGSVPAIMAALGIDMLPPESGVPTIRRELTYGGTKGEILVAGRLGAWMEERDPSGGADVDKINAALAGRSPKLLMVGDVKAVRLYGGLEVETTLDPRVQPFLYDHAPDAGQPWLPGVMGTEALAELATVLTGQGVARSAPPGGGAQTGHSGWRVAAVENEQMLGAFKFFRMEPRTLYLSATITPEGDDLVAHTVLRSLTKPAREGLPVQVKEHFTADVRLVRVAEGLDTPQPGFDTAQPPAQPTATRPTEAFQAPAEADLPITADEIYKSFFHGPAYQVIERAGVQGDRCVALMTHDLPANSAPADVESLMAPRLVELCFQAAALWHVKTHNAMAFPLGFASVSAPRQPAEADGRRLYGIVQTADNGDTFDAQVVDEAGNLFVELKGYRTVGRPG